MEINFLQVGTHFWEGDDYRSDHRYREVAEASDADGGDSGGKEQGDEGDRFPGVPQVKSFQVREQGFVDGVKLQKR